MQQKHEQNREQTRFDQNQESLIEKQHLYELTETEPDIRIPISRPKQKNHPLG